MSAGPKQEETTLFDEVSDFMEKVWNKCKDTAGSFADPKFLSVVLFRRLRANQRGYAVLWKNGCYAESEIIVRAAVETAICIAANFRMGDEFPRLVRRDAAFTLQGQIKLYRDNDDTDMVKSTEEALRYLQRGFSEGEKAARLEWKALAEAGDVPLLYNFHRMLSGASSHVTGISLLRGIGDAETEELQAELIGLSKRNYFNMMAGAALHGALIQSGMIDDGKLAREALALVDRMNALSMDWPGVRA